MATSSSQACASFALNLRRVLAGLRRVPAVFVLIGLACSSMAWAVPTQEAKRVSARVDNAKRQVIPGHLPRWAAAEGDLGVLDAKVQFRNLTVLLSRSAAREAAFQKRLADQQNPASPSYHKWLSPYEVGRQFGPSTKEVNAVSQWLRSQKLQVTSVSPDNMRINFSGSSGAIAHALGTEFHTYKVATRKGVDERIAVNREPSVPAVLAPVIAAFYGLATERLVADDNSVEYNAGTNLHLMTPANFNTIYDVSIAQTHGYNGTGVKVAVISASRVGFAPAASSARMSGS